MRSKTQFTFDDLGERQLKKIDRPVRVYAATSRDHLGTVSPVGLTSAPDAKKPLPFPDKPSIAVLPFQNMSGDPEQEYFTDGMVEDIITALSRFKSLFVIARNSTFTYKGKAVDIKQVGRELGVRYVLEGSVRKAGGKVRITGQLIDAATGAHLWADRFDGPLDDIFELQDKVTSSVVGAIAPRLELAEIERSERKPTESLDAIDLYYRALHRTKRRCPVSDRSWMVDGSTGSPPLRSWNCGRNCNGGPKLWLETPALRQLRLPWCSTCRGSFKLTLCSLFTFGIFYHRDGQQNRMDHCLC